MHEETHVKSLPKLKNRVVREMYSMVIGSLKNLEAQFTEECEAILASRENGYPKLDEKRRETLYSVLRRKF